MDDTKPQSTRWARVPAHESSEVEIKWILISLAMLVAGAVIMHAILGALMAFYHWERGQRSVLLRDQMTAPAIVSSRSGNPRTEPSLQLAPREDLKVLRERENKQLQGYGWIDQSAGIVHIPIERAKDLLLQQGLPTRDQPSATSSKVSPVELIQQRAKESK